MVVLDCATTNVNFDLMIAENNIYQNDRAFTVNLTSNNTEVMFVDSQVEVTILDNDS